MGSEPSDWTAVPLSEVTSRLTRRNTEVNSNVLTISGQHGLVSQTDYFNRRVASANLANYFLLRRGDFAYNKSYSNGYPMGAIKRLDRHESGVVSPLYICFEVSESNEVSSDYLVQYFEGGRFEDELRSVAAEGARNHGLLNVKPGDFFGLRVVLPPLGEQRKIAAILSSVDETIEKTEAVIEQLQVVKKAMMQELLTRGMPGRHTRFKQTEIGEIPESWEVVPTGEALEKLRVGTRYDKRTVSDQGSVPVVDQSADQYLGYHSGEASIHASPETPVVTFANHTCSVRWWTRSFSVIQNVFPIRGKSGVSTRFLFFALQDRVPQTGYKGHWPALMETFVPVPASAEQHEIVSVLDAIAGRLDAEQAAVATLRSTKDALAGALLTGDLRVTPDEAAP